MSNVIPIRRISICRSAAMLIALMALPLVALRAQAAPSHAHPAVTRLHFSPGRSTLVVRGDLSARQIKRSYTFFGRAGQRLHIRVEDLRAPGAGRNDALVTMYHLTFPSGKQYGQKGYDPFQGRLTENGIYRLTIEINTMATNSRHGRYRLILTRSDRG